MKQKSVLLTVQTVLCILTAIVLIAADLAVYIKGSAERSADPMADIYTVEAIGQKAVFIIPVLLVSVIVTIVCLALRVKDAGADKAAVAVDIRKNTDETVPSSSTVKTARIVLLVIAVIFIIVGIFNGSLTDVFVKAAKICTECIGLG